MDLIKQDDPFWPRPHQVPICWLLALVIALEIAAVASQLVMRHH
jgi:hypothetical protein